MSEAVSRIAAYEAEFARGLGVRHTFAFWKGRVALYAALRALGVGEGDEVIVPGYTCVMNVNPIMYLGAKPVYVDIEPVTYNLVPGLVEAAVTPRSRAIIAQHTYGYPAAIDEILAIGDRHKLPVLEDCCLSLGSQWNGQTCGTFGTASYFSFQWNKPYTCGLGGMLATNDDELAEGVRELRRKELTPPSSSEAAMLAAQHAVYRALIYPRTTALAQVVFRWLTRRGVVVGSSSTAELSPQTEEGFFKGMGAAQARRGLRRLRDLQANIAQRRRLTRLYDELLEPLGWKRPALPAEGNPVLVRYPLRVADKQRALAEASRRFVELGSWFECPLHPIETPLEAYGYEQGMCPQAERAAGQVVNLPVHGRVSEKYARRVVEFVREFAAPVEP